MIIPLHLQKNANIGLVSPAGKINKDIVNSFIDAIKAQGYNAILAPHALNSHFQFAASDEQRLADLQIMLDNPEIDAIICLRGGYGTIRLVDKIDFSKFIEKPKWLIGFSDITVLHAAIQNCCKVCSIHGPMAKHIIEAQPLQADIAALWDMLKGVKPSYTIEPHPLNKIGKVKGKVIGGNLSLIHALRGTKYDIKAKGSILFIEDLNEYLYHLDRMMYNLKLSGVLEKLSGIIVGQFTDMKDNEMPFGKNSYEIILEAVKDYDYPVIFNFPAGHCQPNYPLILGATATINVKPENVKVYY